jgi:hypothetical protein
MTDAKKPEDVELYHPMFEKVPDLDPTRIYACMTGWALVELGASTPVLRAAHADLLDLIADWCKLRKRLGMSTTADSHAAAQIVMESMERVKGVISANDAAALALSQATPPKEGN